MSKAHWIVTEDLVEDLSELLCVIWEQVQKGIHVLLEVRCREPPENVDGSSFELRVHGQMKGNS